MRFHRGMKKHPEHDIKRLPFGAPPPGIPKNNFKIVYENA